MLAVVDHFHGMMMRLLKPISQKKFSPLEAIRYFIYYAEYYQDYPEITVVVQAYDSLMYDTRTVGKSQFNHL